MDLKKYNRSDCKYRVPREPSVHIAKVGTFSINKAAVIGLGLKHGDKINLFQDTWRPEDWYIQKTTDEYGLKLRQTNNSLVVNASSVVKEMFKSLNIKEKSATFRISVEPTEEKDEKYFAILTKVPNNHE
jgi:hypothetical protein